MRSSQKFLLTGIFIFAFLSGKAQLIIAKDYNACLYGLTDASGKWVVKPKYTLIRNFNNGIAITMLDNQYGLINNKGVEIVAPQYDYIERECSEQVTYDPHSAGTYNYGYYSNGTNDAYCYKVEKKRLYGLIDLTGKIFLSLQYSEIGCFKEGIVSITDKNGNKGFADYNGVRGMFPSGFFSGMVKSDALASHLYLISRTEKTVIDAKKRKYSYHTTVGVYNDSAREVVPIAYDSINTYAGRNGVIEVYKNGKIGYYYITGEKFWDAVYVVPGAQRNKVPLFNTFGSTPAFDGKKWGVIGAKVILDFKYDSILPLASVYRYDYPVLDTVSPTWKIKQGNKWGVTTKEGKWVLQPIYDNIDDLWWNTALPSAVPDYIFQVKSNGHWGSLSSLGAQVVPFEFDTIFNLKTSLFFWSPQEKMVLRYKTTSNYVVLVNYDYEGELKKYDELHKDEEKQPAYVGDDMPERVNRQTFDIIDLFANSERWYADNTYRYAKPLGTYITTQITQVQQSSSVDPNVDVCYCKINGGDNYYNDPNLFVRDGVYDYDYDFSAIILTDKKGIHNFYLANTSAYTDEKFSYYLINTAALGLIRSDGKILVAPGTFTNISMMRNNPGRFIVQTASNKEGIVDINGKLLVDTVWSQINDMPGDSLWVMKHELKNIPGTACTGEWNLLSLATGKLLLNKKEQLSEPCWLTKGNQIVFGGFGAGLLNTSTFQFTIQPHYQSIYLLAYNSPYYVVTTCHGRMGIVDEKGNWVTDSTWKYITRISTRTFNAQANGAKQSENRFLLSNDTTWAVFDTRNGLLKKSVTLQGAVLQEATFQPSHSTWPDDSRCTDCPWLQNANLSNLQQWEMDYLFKSLFDRNNSFDYRGYSGGRYFNCNCVYYSLDEKTSIPYVQWDNMKRIHHQLYFSNDSCLSLEILNSYNSDNDARYDDFYDHFYYKNVLLFSNGPREMKLDSLFKGDAWRNTIANSVLSYLQQHPGIDANCSNPIMYSKLFNECFTLSWDGITLYPQYWSRTDGKEKQKYEIFIPWSLLKNDLRPDVASKLGIK